MKSKLQTELCLQPSSVIGAVGASLTELTNQILNEISANWNEETMELIKRNGAQLLSQAKDLVIDNPEKYAAANEFFVAVAQYMKSGGSYIDPFVATARQPWAVFCDIRRQFEDPAIEAKKLIGDKITAWKTAERKRIEEDQRRLDAERRAKEDAERMRLEAKARVEREKADQERRAAEEKARVEREAAEKARREKEEAYARARKAETDRLAAEEAQRKAARENDEKAAAAAQAEADRLAAIEASARKASEDAGKEAFLADQRAAREIDRGEIAAQEREQKANAQDAAAASVFIAPTILTNTVAATETTSKGKTIGRGDWNVTITDEMALIKAVASGDLPLSVLNLLPDRCKAAIKRWAEVSLSNVQRYEKNGILLEATEKLSARASTKEK